MRRGVPHGKCSPFAGSNTKPSMPVQVSRRLAHQQLRPGCRQRSYVLLQQRRGSTTSSSRLFATHHIHDGHFGSPVPAAWNPPPQPAVPGTSPYASAPPQSLGAAAIGAEPSFVAASKQQQEQYVRHVQHQDLPGSRQQPQQQHEQQHQQQKPSPMEVYTTPVRVEARNRGNKGAQPGSQEPVFSYTQLFSQEMTPTASTAAAGKPQRSTQQQQQPPQPPAAATSKGFGRSRARKSSSSSGGSSGSNGGSSGGSGGAATASVAHVKLSITRQVEYGQCMRVTGSTGHLGDWDADKGPELQWHEGHKWTADVALPPGGYEFKFLLQHRSGHLEWEGGSNRSFAVPRTAADMVVEGRWGATEDTEVLELQQQAAYRQQMQQLQQQEAALQEAEATARAEAAAFAAANKAAAAAYQREADAEAAAAAATAAAAAVERPERQRVAREPPADLFKVDLSVLDPDLPGHQQLMQVLLGFRQDMMEGLWGVTSTMQEIQDELSQVQQQMSRLAAERLLDASALGSGDAAAAAAGAGGGGQGLTAATAAIIAADAAVSQEQALSGLQGVVQSWQQELLSFRQDSHDLRHELEVLRVSLEQQMADNTSAVYDLEALVRRLMAAADPTLLAAAAAASIRTAAPGAAAADKAPGSPPPGSPPPGAAAAGAAAAGGAAAGGRVGSPGGGGTPGTSELLDAEDQQLLERINHLASDLSAEMKEAVQELELQQQSLLERHQHIIADLSLSNSNSSGNNKNRLALDLGFGPGLGMRMQPTTATGGGVASSSSSRGLQQAPQHVLRAAAVWLESHDVAQYHAGLLLTVMASCGLWREGLWEQLETGGALRTCFTSYKSVWSEACLQTWKDTITTKHALLTALSTGRQQLLSMHILWSLQELSGHCKLLQALLPEVATPIELGLMQKLRQKGGAGQGWALGVTGAPVGGGEAAAAAQCAVLLQRWLAAADGRW